MNDVSAGIKIVTRHVPAKGDIYCGDVYRSGEEPVMRYYILCHTGIQWLAIDLASGHRWATPSLLREVAIDGLEYVEQGTVLQIICQ